MQFPQIFSNSENAGLKLGEEEVKIGTNAKAEELSNARESESRQEVSSGGCTVVRRRTRAERLQSKNNSEKWL